MTLEIGAFVQTDNSPLAARLVKLTGSIAIIEIAGQREAAPVTSLSLPPNFTVRSGDLLMAPTQYIAHQCNCVSHNVAGLAAVIFTKWPDANVYRDRNSRLNHKHLFGNYTLHGRVVNLYTQLYPGKATPRQDSSQNRLAAFQTSLDLLAKLPGIPSVAFPYGIGCGLAGGHWPDYLFVLTRWAHWNKDISITLFRK